MSAQKAFQGGNNFKAGDGGGGRKTNLPQSGGWDRPVGPWMPGCQSGEMDPLIPTRHQDRGGTFMVPLRCFLSNPTGTYSSPCVDSCRKQMSVAATSTEGLQASETILTQDLTCNYACNPTPMSQNHFVSIAGNSEEVGLGVWLSL